MQFQTATPPPPPADWEGAPEINLQIPLRHIPAGDARIFEGWASLSGVDYHDHSIPALLFEEAAAEYMRKNPVILWDHIRSLPIGRVLRMRIEERGVYIRGEIFQGEQIRSAVTGDVDHPSIAMVADEAWNLIKLGGARGLSIRCKKRGPFKEINTSYGTVKEPQEIVLIYEISVTPIQVSPGAQIDGVNLLAKALSWAPPPGEETMTKEELLAAQEALLKASREYAKSGEELPSEFLERHDILTKALGGSPPGSGDGGDLEKGLELKRQQEIDDLKKRLTDLETIPAPSRARQTLDSSPAAAVRPTGPVDAKHALTKAVELAGDPVKSARLGFEIDELPYPADLFKMIAAKSNGKIRVREEISISPHAQEYCQRVSQLVEQGKL